VLNIPLTLNSGQVFRWRREPDGLWWGTVEDTLVALRPAQDGFGWATWPSDRWPVISRFLSLETDLPALYRDWAAADPSFGALIGAFRGLRVLRQSADAALVSFVCSSCNNVPRIACMVTSLAELIGDRIENPWGLDARTDPSVEDLANITEDDLRELRFGYRSRYLQALGRSAESVAAARHAPAWQDARAALMRLPGVGPKVADCVGLFGLGHADVVPVDTHVRRYVVERLRPDLAGRALTANVYASLASAFCGIMGPYAGWAQQYVFMQARAERAARTGSEEER